MKISGKRVLLVEDEAQSANALARLLRDDGYEVEVLYDGAAAIGRLTRDPLPDALVTDLCIPHVDGLAVARYARARKPSMLLVFLTSYPQLLPSRDGERFRPDAFVHTKPLDYSSLVRQLAAGAELQ